MAGGGQSCALSKFDFLLSFDSSKLDLTPFSFLALPPSCCIFSVLDSFWLPTLFENPLTSFPFSLFTSKFLQLSVSLLFCIKVDLLFDFVEFTYPFLLAGGVGFFKPLALSCDWELFVDILNEELGTFPSVLVGTKGLGERLLLNNVVDFSKDDFDTDFSVETLVLDSVT